MVEDPNIVQKKYIMGEIDLLDVIRRYGVILDWGTNEVLWETTREYREMLNTRTIKYWN